MEFTLLPSECLNVVIEESDKKNSTTAKNLHLSKNLPSSLTISPVVPKYSTCHGRKLNGKCSTKTESFEFADGLARRNDYLALKKRLPRTVLEECVVELASPRKRCDTVPEFGGNAIIIEPMYTKKPEEWESNNEKTDLPDIFNQVEVVYSDDDESPSKNEANDSSSLIFSAETINMHPYACDHCPNKYTNKGALWQHKVAAHSAEKSCECQLCGRKFYRNCSLALHMKCHSDEQNCSCKICGKEFNRMSMLERHSRCHATDRSAVGALSFGCKICGKQFNDETTLKTHVLSHSDKYTCDQCSVTFNTKQLLDLHFHMTHKRSETPFVCKLCKARFANLCELNDHSLSHAFEKSRISCHHCGEVFTQRCTYKKHLQLHVGERLSCIICRIDFTQRSSLLRHYKRIHLMNDIPITSGIIESPNLVATS